MLALLTGLNDQVAKSVFGQLNRTRRYGVRRIWVSGHVGQPPGGADYPLINHRALFKVD